VSLAGADRPKAIAIFASTRAEAEMAVRHAQTGNTNLPLWVWCGEECEEPIAGCDRLICDKGLSSVREIWPALSIVAWTGARSSIVRKLLPLVLPPFRVVAFNEAGGFFPAKPGAIASHATRRLKDGTTAKVRFAAEWSAGACKWVGARFRDAAQWIFWIIVNAGLWIFRMFRRVLDVILLLWSLVYRGAERVRDCFHWIEESLLALAAKRAAALGPWARTTVQQARRKGHRQLSIDAGRQTARSSAPTAEVLLPNRVWPRRAIVAAVKSDAEFIVLRKQGEAASVDRLLEVARATGAFAVARQTAWSSWRKTAVPRHPFRRLQPGEVAEVFAPFSSLIVIRRDTVAALGVPRGLTAGAALLALFWKACAAGLRNLVVGHEGQITDEQEMSLEDAEFALRLRFSPRLAGLGPERPSRYRGNLAWSPKHMFPFRGKPRVLVVSPYLPFPLSHGGAVRIYNLCRSLSDRVDFVLACFHEANETIEYNPLGEVFREIYVVDIDEKHSDATVPRQIAEYRNAAMSDLIRHLCVKAAIDLVQLEYTQMAEYRIHAGSVPTILVEHDITFTLYEQLSEFNREAETRREYERWRDFEREALQCSNAVWTMSEDEREVALKHRSPRNRTLVIPNGVDLQRFKPERKPSGRREILFVGSFRHLPNLLAYEALRTMIMPTVWLEYPDAVLHVIAGPRHEAAASAAGKAELLKPHPQVRMEGFVSDVAPAYQNCDVVAVPLPLSAGTNIKLLEAMGSGRTIVSTESGCRGLGLKNGVELVVTELDGSFGEAIVMLLGDDHLRERMAQEARRAAVHRFGWDAIAEDAFTSYLELISGRAVTATPEWTEVSPAS
jgi:glycosyltransferase involved in cell wall biosynthesis